MNELTTIIMPKDGCTIIIVFYFSEQSDSFNETIILNLLDSQINIFRLTHCSVLY